MLCLTLDKGRKLEELDDRFGSFFVCCNSHKSFQVFRFEHPGETVDIQDINETCSHTVKDKSQNFIYKFLSKLPSKFTLFRQKVEMINSFARVAPISVVQNPVFFLENLFLFYWLSTCSISHISFTSSSLVMCHSFWEGRFQALAV